MSEPYFKLKSYAKNFEKYSKGEKQGQYIHLDFAYLQELSRLDSDFRKFIFKISLDIEHFAKTKLNKDFASNLTEDGYQIIVDFLNQYPYIKKNINQKAKYGDSACADLIKKYENKFALWNIVEVLSFGDFIKLYSFYYTKYPDSTAYSNLLWSVKFLRNAAAHNNCLLNTLKTPYTGIERNKQINTLISKIPYISPIERKKKMSNPIIHDFIVTLVVFDKLVTSTNTKQVIYNELNSLINIRFIQNKDYYCKNQIISTNYKFTKKVVDYFIENFI